MATEDDQISIRILHPDRAEKTHQRGIEYGHQIFSNPILENSHQVVLRITDKQSSHY
jgi:hypothetical protein